MIDVDGKALNPAFIVSAEIETRHYLDGSASWLVVQMADGSEIRREHGWGFDAFKTNEAIRSALKKLKE